MAYTITTGLETDMKDAFEKQLKEVNNTKDRDAIIKAFQALVDVLFIEFTAVDTGA